MKAKVRKQPKLQIPQEAVEAIKYLGDLSSNWLKKVTPEEVTVESIPGRIWKIKQWNFGEQTSFLGKWRDQLGDTGLPKDSSKDFEYKLDILAKSVKEAPIELTPEAIEKSDKDEAGGR